MGILSWEEGEILLQSHGAEHNANATVVVPNLAANYDADTEPHIPME